MFFFQCQIFVIIFCCHSLFKIFPSSLTILHRNKISAQQQEVPGTGHLTVSQPVWQRSLAMFLIHPSLASSSKTLNKPVWWKRAFVFYHFNEIPKIKLIHGKIYRNSQKIYISFIVDHKITTEHTYTSICGCKYDSKKRTLFLKPSYLKQKK